MTRRTIYQHKESGMYIVYHVFWRGNWSAGMDGEMEYCGRTKIKQFEVFTKSGEEIKIIGGNSFEHSKNSKEYYSRYFQLARMWLETFYYKSMYRNPVKCNNINGVTFNSIYCPFLQIRRNAPAICQIVPNSYGYSSGINGRALPESLECDMGKWKEALSHLNNELNVFCFTFQEYHICASGKGKEMIEKEPIIIEKQTTDLYYEGDNT